MRTEHSVTRVTIIPSDGVFNSHRTLQIIFLFYLYLLPLVDTIVSLRLLQGHFDSLVFGPASKHLSVQTYSGAHSDS